MFDSPAGVAWTLAPGCEGGGGAATNALLPCLRFLFNRLRSRAERPVKSSSVGGGGKDEVEGEDAAGVQDVERGGGEGSFSLGPKSLVGEIGETAEDDDSVASSI